MPSSMTADLLLPLLFLHLFITKMAKEPELSLATAIKLPISKSFSTQLLLRFSPAQALKLKLL
jgi:hypothetical protein